MEVDENQNVVTGRVGPSPGFTSVHDSFCHGAVKLFERPESACSKCLKSELSPNDVGIRLVNKKHCLVSLPPTAAPLMVDVKVDHVVSENTYESAVELSSSARNA